MRILEGAAAVTSFATGITAIGNTLFTLLSRGDRVVSISVGTEDVENLITDLAQALGIA